ncbi:hypothetical protein AB4305_32865 [Nocardia sp. 2YAB30]|uniref:hypothetical protein n=1 Tax=unclassified Nocardia TaxID=2637762 RepID=UPI003F9C9EC5
MTDYMPLPPSGAATASTITDDQLDIARARQARGESVTAIAAHLGVGRSTCTAHFNPTKRPQRSPNGRTREW